MTHDWYDILRHFWWLIFPLFWMVAAVARHWTYHLRANRVLDLVKSYADQGKEPPPELLKALQGPFRHDGSEWREHRHSHRHGWRGVFLFTALALAFAVMAWQADAGIHDHATGLVFVAIIMAGLAAGNLVAALAQRRDGDADRTPPQ
ncbi:MAG TPA: hypothetical protein VHC40_08765 [Rhizomicrobium sp.]|jgi:hypothetical protein|nr:hypothetical protein [Rhizomicrobium sp.]